MHELFMQVLGKKDLSKAGDLFSVADQAIVNDLTEVVNTIAEITSLPDYVNNDNDQSVVEICITRVTSCIRETGSIQQHSEALVGLLESCLNHNLKPSPKDEDPPHAKIASDIISCIFLNYGKKDVMKRALPVAVKFLHKGNKELSRNMASYLSLAAIENADLLSQHIQLIIDSIISGNYPLCRVLPQMYAVNKEPLHDHVMALVSLMPLCDNSEKLALLNLFALIAKEKPQLLEPSLPQLCEYLSAGPTASATLQVFLDMAGKRPQLLLDHVPKIKQTAESYPNTLCLAAQVISSVGKLSKDRAQEALNFVLEQLHKADRGSQGTLLREATLLCSSYPVLFTDKMLAEVRGHKTQTNSVPAAQHPAPVHSSQVNQTCGGVTIVKVGGSRPDLQQQQLLHSQQQSALTSVAANKELVCPSQMVRMQQEGGWLNRQEANRLVVSRPRLGGDSRSTGRLHTSAAHRSMTRLNVGGSRVGSVGGLHKSMTRLSSSQQINQISVATAASGNRSVTAINGAGGGGRQYHVSAVAAAVPHHQHVSSGGVTVTTTASPSKNSMGSGTGLRDDLMLSISTSYPQPTTQPGPLVIQAGGGNNNVCLLSQSGTRLATTAVSSGRSCLSGSGNVAASPPPPVTSAVTTRRPNTSVTIINNCQNSVAATAQRISVFEPYPMRDTVQHFCEKHLDKIKSYMDKVSVRIPPPAKCTIEERRAKKVAKLHFACQGRGEHCLYNRTFFTMKTRNPRIWIHLMFLALQARSDSALSSRDSSVSSLKNCWDILKCENKTFLTLVTSAFPCSKDQDALLNELRHSGFFDVFECSGGQWGCFLCNHPERAVGFLQDSQPVIEGQLKEKKGRWKIFRRWRTRYFTLSGAHLSYKGSKDDKDVTPIEVNQIRSVKVSRGARNIPKAFEIFTGDQSLILKPKDGKNAEEWVQCLSIVVAHSHSREVPAKSNSLPARGASLRTAV
ncbi:protein melted isoform X1 [Schistocerca nitens]|uniref:protein melted isoform X1 n=2 Tax=Schistocerca nitens TaxID=7011 RepID=UPI002118714E|nr:protein melted isoform X1 [Schistocerca nitens]XP_049810599.1 protein melted isoform X1 [Schistocerca nitens]XP_049810600.1 protein melted isoform X1 [Schistocerca nitens]